MAFVGAGSARPGAIYTGSPDKGKAIMKAITVIAIMLVVALLTTSCDSQPPFSADEAIRLAKEDSYKIPSPPSIYRPSGPAVGTGGYISSWPDEPGTKADVYGTCADLACSHPITLTTTVDINNGGYDVIFKSEWEVSASITKAHSWLFHVSADRNAMFVREEGDMLPPAPERGPLSRTATGCDNKQVAKSESPEQSLRSIRGLVALTSIAA